MMGEKRGIVQMDKLVELVNKHKGTAFMILFCIITVPIILCQIIYKIETPYEWLNGEFGGRRVIRLYWKFSNFCWYYYFGIFGSETKY